MFTLVSSKPMSNLHRETLLVLPSVHACVDTINALHSQFKAHHKRNAVVELLYSNTFSTDPERMDEPDGHLITLQAAQDADQGALAEMEWFRATASAILVNA